MGKKFLSLFVFLLVVVGSVSVGVCATKQGVPAKKPIVVGWFLSLSGPFASLSLDLYKSVLPLMEIINKEGGIAGHPLKMIVVDSESDPVKAVLAAKRLILKDNVHMLVGEPVTGMLIPVGLAIAEYKIALLGHAGSEMFDIKMREAGKEVYYWNFTVGNAPFEEMMTVTSKFGRSLGTKVAVLYPETSFGKSMSAAFKQYAKKYGLDVVVDESYPADATVFGPQIAAIKARPNLELITFHGAEYATALCGAAIREAGIALPMVAYYSSTTGTILEIEKVRKAYAMNPRLYVVSNAIECWESLPADDPRRAPMARWSGLHEKITGKKLTFSFEAFTYGTMDLIKDVWGRLLKDRPDILDQDSATIRSAVRDYVETARNIVLAGGLVTYSPEKHHGFIPGTSNLMSQFRWPPPFDYVPGFEATMPPWRK